jgi:hypothetical protein
MAKAILIDPRDVSVKYVEYEATVDAIQTMIGGYLQLAHVFPSGDVLYVDEEGLCKNLTPGPTDKATCFCVHAHQVFAGKGVVVGEDEQGGLTDVKMTVPEILMRTRFAYPKG